MAIDRSQLWVAFALLVGYVGTLSGAEPNRASQHGGSNGAATPPHFYNNVQVLCVGINEYQHLPHPLNQAEADAQLVGETMRTQFGYDATYLLGSNATKSRIIRTIEELDQKLGVDDALIVYVAGHGVAFTRIDRKGSVPLPRRVGFILPYDADVQFENPHDPRWDREAIDMAAFVERLNKCQAHHVLVIADCCCSGFMTKRGQQQIGTYVNLLLHPSRTVLAATTQNERANDGLFAGALVKTLEQYKSNREPATVTDIFDEVRGPVISKSLREMTPQLSHVGSGDGEFVFFPINLPATQVKKVREQVGLARTDKGRPIPSDLSRGLFSGVIERANKRAGRRTKLSEFNATMTAEKYWYGKVAAERRDYWRAMRDEFHKNAAWGDTLAMAGLHFCYEKGLGEATEKKDPKAAYEWALAATNVDEGSGVGEYLLGRCYELGIGTEKNLATSRELYRKSADKGFVAGRLADAQVSLRRNPTAENARKYIPIMRDAAQMGLSHAHMVLGDVYLMGSPWGVDRNLVEAYSNIQAAFDDKHYLGTSALFLAYTGQVPGFEELDPSKAELVIRQAADAGNASGQYHLGVNLLRPPKVEPHLQLTRDAEQGLYWLEQAAAQNEVQALIVLAELYGYGWDPGVPTDHTKAKARIESAVAAGSSDAMVIKGNWLRGDHGIYEADLKAALVSFQNAGAAGNPIGCDQAGRCYEAGLGVEVPEKFKVAGALHPKSHVALHWYWLATKASEGSKHAEGRIEHFRQLLEAEKRGRMIAPGFEPTFVLQTWKQVFPDSAQAFEAEALEGNMSQGAPLNDVSGDSNGELPSGEDQSVALRLQLEGVSLLEAKKYKQAYDLFTKSITEDRTNCKTYSLRGVASRKLGDLRGAVADYTLAIGINPEESRFYVNRSMVLFDMKDYEGAHKDAETAIRLEPAYGKGHLLLGNAHIGLGNFDQAISAFNLAIERDLDKRSTAEAYHNRGVAWERKGDQSKAQEDFRRARSLGLQR